MPRQSRKRLAQLIEQFPAVAQIRSRLTGEDRGIQTVTRVVVQKPDPEFMHLQAKNVYYDGRSYVEDLQYSPPRRGTRFQYLVAVNHNDQIVRMLSWRRGTDDFQIKSVKDIFFWLQDEDPEVIKYLMWITIYGWYEPASEEREELGLYFGPFLEQELEVVVYPKPKKGSWMELVWTAVRIKHERETAYLYNPKVMPEFPGIHQAFKEGCRLHAFRSGGGLRVVSLSKDGKDDAYGEHPHVEEALNHLEEDFLAGDRPYQEVYGGKYPHYLTGASLATSNLDHWVVCGHTFDVWQEGEEVIFQLSGYTQYQMPDNIKKITTASPGVPVFWKARGYTFEAVYQEHLFADGSAGHSLRTLKSPRGRANSDPWFYQITKTGRGADFWQAMVAAFAAEEQEVTKKKPRKS